MDTPQFHLMHSGFFFQISVSKPARADNGTYRLVATNELGCDELDFQIIVVGMLTIWQALSCVGVRYCVMKAVGKSTSALGVEYRQLLNT